MQGDVVGIVTKTGEWLASYTYDAWGNPLETTVSESVTNAAAIANTNPLRYRGYVYDTETGLYYLQSRYYNPEIGRFLNADALVSTGQGVLGNNMFAYCRDNPVCYTDFTGTADQIAYNDGELLSDDDLNQIATGGGTTNGPVRPSVQTLTSSPSNTAQTNSASVNPLRNIIYSDKVLQQIQQGDFHSFSCIVDNYGAYGTQELITGGDGKIYYKLSIAGSYRGYDGHFVYIWDACNFCNHRFFEVSY